MNASSPSSAPATALSSVLGVLILLPMAPPVAAQTPPPVAPPASSTPAPVPASVLLTYKFSPGRVQRFRANLNSQVTLTRDGEPAPGGGARPNSIEMDGVMTCAEKVLGTREGVGTVLLSQSSTQATLVASGATFVTKVVNGKLVVTRNGQPLAPGALPPGLTSTALLPAPVTFYRLPNGQVKLQENGASDAAPRFGWMPLVAVAEFPDHPVKIGEKWQGRRQFTGQGLGPSLPGASGISNLRLTHELKTLQRQGRRLIAMIETSGENADLPAVGGENPPEAPQSVLGLVQTLVGVTYFDVERGELMASQFAAELTGAIVVPSTAPGTPGGPSASGASIRVDGQIGVRLAEVIETPSPVVPAPKPPVAKKPTPRRPAAPRKR